MRHGHDDRASPSLPGSAATSTRHWPEPSIEPVVKKRLVPGAA